MIPEDQSPELVQYGYLESMPRASDLLLSVSVSAEVYKAKIIDVAVAASEELRQMAQVQEPLWLFDTNKQTEVLDEAEYKRRFIIHGDLDSTLDEIIKVIAKGGPIDIPNLNAEATSETENSAISETEASRANGIVFVDPVNLVHMLMDVVQWSCVFSNIVSKATNLGILLTGADGNLDGALQVMTAQFHLPCPLVKPREVLFARYSRQLDCNTWLVADVSLEGVFPNPLVQCQRRPSGCIIQGLQSGLSLVTWVENNVVCNGLVPQMIRQIVKSGTGFSAKRWMLTMERHYDRHATQQSEQTMQVDSQGEGKKKLLNLAERMVRSYNAIFSNENQWMHLRMHGEDDDVFVKTSFNLHAPGTPRGVAITISTSLWLPIPPKDIFEFLRAGQNRVKWDLLSYGCMIRDVLHISLGRDPANSVSLVTVEAGNGRADEIYYIHESFTDSTGMYIVYAPVDREAVQYIMEGKESDSVAILASGFAILPDTDSTSINAASVITIAFQLMDEELSTPEYLPPHSLLTANTLLSQTASLIKASLLSGVF